MKVRDWDPVVVAELTAKHFNEEETEWVEGPARLGSDYRVWRIWTLKKIPGQHEGEYQAHYAVAYRDNETLTFFRNFDPFADFVSNRFDAERMLFVEERRHEMRLALLKTASAILTLFVFVGLVGYLAVYNANALSTAALASSIVGAVIAFLFAPAVRNRLAKKD